MAAGDVACSITNPTSALCNIFDGVDDYVEIPHNPAQLGANLTNGFTISAWINPRSVGEGSSGRILDKTAGTAAENGFRFAVGTTERVIISINAGTTAGTGTGSFKYNNLWRHVLVTVSSGKLANFYINGILTGTANQDLVQTISTITTTNAMRIGCNSTNTDRAFDGGIRNVKMWNRVLTTTEIQQEAVGKDVVDQSLIHWFKLAGDYNDYGLVGVAATNSGSVVQSLEDGFATVLKASRKTANDKYLTDEINGKIFLSAIEES